MTVHEPDRSPGRRLAVAAALVFLVLLVVGIVPRALRSRALRAEVSAPERGIPIVATVVARRAAITSDLTLPGTVQALHETSIYARGNGFVRRWTTDLGGRVRAGQLLAEIETPELDQELSQARANLAQVQASVGLTRATLGRWNDLVKDSAATQQELDEKQAAFTAASANERAVKASVQRLVELQRFGQVIAPFAGIITARQVDVGTLVSAGGGSGSRALFTLAQADTVRVFVNVPSIYAASIAPGRAAEVVVQELPGGGVRGVVARTASSIDPATRTLLTEVDIANAKHVLIPGMYAQVRFSVDRPRPPLIITANALVMRSSGPQVAVVRSGRVHLQTVELGRDYGKEVEVVSGIDEGAELIVNPSDDIVEGVAVKTQPVPQTEGVGKRG